MSYLLYYNHQKKLKALKFKTPYNMLLEKFDTSPELFMVDGVCLGVTKNK